MAKVGRKILFDGCDYNCFNCRYPDCLCPDILVKEELSQEEQRTLLKKSRERSLRNYERRHHKND